MTAPDEVALVDRVIARARKAQLAFEASGSQERYDQAAQAVGWAIMEPARNRSLAELAVQTTGLGNVADKITKNHRKTLGLLRDIADAKTYGIISDDPATDYGHADLWMAKDADVQVWSKLHNWLLSH